MPEQDAAARPAPMTAAVRWTTRVASRPHVIEEMVGQGRPADKGSVWVLDPEHDLEPRRSMLQE